MDNNIEIEEDVKILKNLKEQVSTTYYCNHYSKIDKAIENILADRERLEKENKEMSRKLRIKNGDVEYLQRKINKHFISDAEIVRKIEELKNTKTQLPTEHMKQAQITILQELLDTAEEKK